MIGNEWTRGCVIGDVVATGWLCYDGRRQTGALRGDNEAAVIALARAEMERLIAEYGGHPCYCYTDGAKWTVQFVNKEAGFVL